MATVERFKFDVDLYEKMIAANILQHGQPLELLNGEIYQMPPMKTPHAYLVEYLDDFFHEKLSNQFSIRVQLPIVLPTDSEPEPDLVIAKRQRYRQRHPHPADIFVIVEVADSTLAYDRNLKVPLYARHAIPEVWLVEVETQQITVYQQSDGQVFQQQNCWQVGEKLVSPLFPELNLDLHDLFLG